MQALKSSVAVNVLLATLLACTGISQLAAQRLPAQPQLAAGQFLLAARSLAEPTFARTVILLVHYDASGAYGVIVNRPTELRVHDALPGLADLSGADAWLHSGGPVAPAQVAILVRTDTPPRGTQHVFDDIHVSNSLGVLRELIERDGAQLEFRVYAGYAGWGSGQLDNEVERGDWHIVPADTASVLSSKPDDVWHRLIERASGTWVQRLPTPFQLTTKPS